MRPRRRLLLGLAALAGAAIAPTAFGNGDGFFRANEIPGNPEFVYFGNVRDAQGKYVAGAKVTVHVAEHMLEYSAITDVLGHYRTPDVGRAIKELGYEVDLSLVTVTVECPGYRVASARNRGRYRQSKGAIELNFRLVRASP